MSIFDSFLEIAGNLGFLVGNNDKRRERARKDRRSWGAEQDGFVISLSANTLEPRPDESVRAELALKNVGSETRELEVGNWLDFFTLKVIQPDESLAALTSFGRNQMQVARAALRHTVQLPPGEILDSDLPIAAFYELNQKGVYTISAGFRSGSAVSNIVQIRI